MARPEEKARATLNRWLEMKKSGRKNKKQKKRPHLASSCSHLPEAEYWRSQILREIGQKVSQIQDGLFTFLLLSLCCTEVILFLSFEREKIETKN